MAAGVLQILLGAAQILGVRLADVINGGHVSHESAAWNIALGAAFLSVARIERCPPALLIILTAFVAVLTLLTITDVLAGRVGAARIGTHSIMVAGYALTLRLRRASGPGSDESPPPMTTAPAPVRHGHHVAGMPVAVRGNRAGPGRVRRLR